MFPLHDMTSMFPNKFECDSMPVTIKIKNLNNMLGSRGGKVVEVRDDCAERYKQ